MANIAVTPGYRDLIRVMDEPCPIEWRGRDLSDDEVFIVYTRVVSHKKVTCLTEAASLWRDFCGGGALAEARRRAGEWWKVRGCKTHG